jgi:Flp pilus assembly protein TadG
MKTNQKGATIVEFSLSLIVFLTFLLGIVDFARMLFTWNAASEAARMGARYAVVCDSTAEKAVVLNRMQRMLPQIADIDLAWVPAACTSANCTGVNITITSLNYQWISPVAGMAARAAIPMPTFSTFLPREVMKQDPNSDTTICTS